MDREVTVLFLLYSFVNSMDFVYQNEPGYFEHNCSKVTKVFNVKDLLLLAWSVVAQLRTLLGSILPTESE